MSLIRILIADDSPVMRTLYRQVLSPDTGFEIVGEVGDGAAAVEACSRLRPQVVAMDVEMPGLSGIEATAAIMRQCPTPVVIISNALDSRASRLAMDAFGAGAVDVVPKPNMTDREVGRRAIRQLLETLKAMSAVRVIRRRDRQAVTAGTAVVTERPAGCRVIGIGASTGGPEAVRLLLATLPESFPIPIVLVQHMVTDFLPSLVTWLNSTVALSVRLAEDGQALGSGGVIVAPGAHHIRLDPATDRVCLDPREAGSRYHPSVDVLFDSLLGYGGSAMGILLTGMGDDGAAGLKRMREAGALTLAQDEESSIVWGMPGVAVRNGAATFVGAPRQIAGHVLTSLAGHSQT